MKKILLFASLLAVLLTQQTASAQNQAYCRDGFETNTFPTGAPTVAAPIQLYATTDCGTYYVYGTYSTNGGAGTQCTSPYAVRHVRFSSAAVDSPYLVTPVVDYGIQEFHFTRARAGRRYTIQTTVDTNAVTATWVTAAFVNVSNTTCADTSILIAQPLARRLRIVARQGTDSDVDSVYITSVATLPVAYPISFTNIKAYQKSTGIQLDWSNATEANMNNYAIERSYDGRTFNEIASITATGNRNNLVNYSWYDATPLKGTNFYRVKGVEKDGNTKYTSVLKVAIGKGNVEVNVAPNPIKGNLVNVQLSNLTKGAYNLNVYNQVGQQVYSKAITHDGGSATLQLQLPSAVKTGLYNLQLKGEATTVNKKIVVQ